MNKSKRDELASNYCELDIELPSTYKTFLAGYSAGFAEAQEQAKVLVESFSKINLSHDFDCAIAVNGRHECSCGYLDAKKALAAYKATEPSSKDPQK